MGNKITEGIDFSPKPGQIRQKNQAPIIKFEEIEEQHLRKEDELFDSILYELQKTTYSRYQPELYQRVVNQESKLPLHLPTFDIRTEKDADEYEFVKDYAILLARYADTVSPTNTILVEDILHEFYARDRVLKSETE